MFKINLPSKEGIFEARYSTSGKLYRAKIGIGDRDNANWKVEIRFGDTDQIRGFGELLVEMANKIENEGDNK